MRLLGDSRVWFVPPNLLLCAECLLGLFQDLSLSLLCKGLRCLLLLLEGFLHFSEFGTVLLYFLFLGVVTLLLGHRMLLRLYSFDPLLFVGLAGRVFHHNGLHFTETLVAPNHVLEHLLFRMVTHKFLLLLVFKFCFLTSKCCLLLGLLVLLPALGFELGLFFGHSVALPQFCQVAGRLRLHNRLLRCRCRHDRGTRGYVALQFSLSHDGGNLRPVSGPQACLLGCRRCWQVLYNRLSQGIKLAFADLLKGFLLSRHLHFLVPV